MTEDRAHQLRDAFDREFAEAPRPPAPAELDLLRISLGGEPYALAMAEITALYADLPITPVPTTRREFLGVASVRGAIIPVYDLPLLIGVAASEGSRWTVLVGNGTAGLAFEAFTGHARVVATDVARTSGGGTIRGSVPLDGQLYAVVNLETVMKSIRRDEEPK